MLRSSIRLDSFISALAQKDYSKAKSIIENNKKFHTSKQGVVDFSFDSDQSKNIFDLLAEDLTSAKYKSDAQQLLLSLCELEWASKDQLDNIFQKSQFSSKKLIFNILVESDKELARKILSYLTPLEVYDMIKTSSQEKKTKVSPEAISSAALCSTPETLKELLTDFSYDPGNKDIIGTYAVITNYIQNSKNSADHNKLLNLEINRKLLKSKLNKKPIKEQYDKLQKKNLTSSYSKINVKLNSAEVNNAELPSVASSLLNTPSSSNSSMLLQTPSKENSMECNYEIQPEEAENETTLSSTTLTNS